MATIHPTLINDNEVDSIPSIDSLYCTRRRRSSNNSNKRNKVMDILANADHDNINVTSNTSNFMDDLDQILNDDELLSIPKPRLDDLLAKYHDAYCATTLERGKITQLFGHSTSTDINSIMYPSMLPLDQPELITEDDAELISINREANHAGRSLTFQIYDHKNREVYVRQANELLAKQRTPPNSRPSSPAAATPPNLFASSPLIIFNSPHNNNSNKRRVRGSRVYIKSKTGQQVISSNNSRPPSSVIIFGTEISSTQTLLSPITPSSIDATAQSVPSPFSNVNQSKQQQQGSRGIYGQKWQGKHKRTSPRLAVKRGQEQNHNEMITIHMAFPSASTTSSITSRKW
jgi:hypothetical protein